MADRSSDSIGRPGSNWTVDGPSKSPARSPRTRRASAWATSRPSFRSSSNVDPAKDHSGSSMASTTIGRTGVEFSHLAVSSAVSRAVRSVARSSRPSVASASAASRPSRLDLHLSLPRVVIQSRGARPVVERVETGCGSDAELDDLAAEGAGHDGPLALRVAWDVHAPPEGDAARGEGLCQGGLPTADLAGETDVGVGQRSLAVQLPRVVAEGRPGPGVLADQHSCRAEPLLGEERVGAGQHLGSGPVRDEPEAAVGTAGHRAGLATSGQERPFALVSAERLQLGPALLE